MKRFVCAVLLITVAAGLTGCFVSVNGACKSDKHSDDSKDAKQVDTAINEIDAAKTLSSDEAKLRVLSAIASRPGLSQDARVNLIESAKMLSDDAAKEQLLMIIANNYPKPSVKLLPPKPCKEHMPPLPPVPPAASEVPLKP